jgi:hypothetical protein
MCKGDAAVKKQFTRVRSLCSAALRLLATTFLVLTTESALAENLAQSGDRRWVVVASREDLVEAVRLGNTFINFSPRVVRSKTGWLAVVLGPYSVSSVDDFRNRHGISNLPSDALLARGTDFTETVWSPNHRWIVAASRQNLDEAINVAKSLSELRPRVVRSENGWYAVVLGPFITSSIDQFRASNAAQGLPSDAMLARGSNFLQTAWLPEGVSLGKAEPTVVSQNQTAKTEIEVNYLSHLNSLGLSFSEYVAKIRSQYDPRKWRYIPPVNSEEVKVLFELWSNSTAIGSAERGRHGLTFDQYLQVQRRRLSAEEFSSLFKEVEAAKKYWGAPYTREEIEAYRYMDEYFKNPEKFRKANEIATRKSMEYLANIADRQIREAQREKFNAQSPVAQPASSGGLGLDLSDILNIAGAIAGGLSAGGGSLGPIGGISGGACARPNCPTGYLSFMPGYGKCPICAPYGQGAGQVPRRGRESDISR